MFNIYYPSRLFQIQILEYGTSLLVAQCDNHDGYHTELHLFSLASNFVRLFESSALVTEVVVSAILHFSSVVEKVPRKTFTAFASFFLLPDAAGFIARLPKGLLRYMEKIMPLQLRRVGQENNVLVVAIKILKGGCYKQETLISYRHWPTCVLITK